jgi:hypothetical protein
MNRTKKIQTIVAKNYLVFLPLIVAALVMLVLILHYVVNTPFWDQWEMVPLFQKVDHHSLTIGNLWQQHNEHRIFFPLIVLLISAYITHWNTAAEVLIGFIFACTTATLIFLMLKKSIGRWWLGLLAGVLIGAWFFSPIQWENWLWGWQVEWFMCMAAVTTSVFLLTKFSDSTSQNRIIFYSLAMLSGIIASFSLAGGLFVWILGIFILWATKQGKKLLSIWTVTGVLCTILYYFRYIPQPGPNGATTTFFLSHPLGYAEFFLAYLGGPVGSLTDNLQAPLIVGLMLILLLLPVLYLLWRRRSEIRAFAPWVAFIIFGILGGLSTGVGRLSYGVGFALSSRYTAFSLFYIIGMTVVVFMLLDRLKKPSYEFSTVAVSCLVLLSLPLLVSSYSVGIHGFRTQSALLKEIRGCTHSVDPSEACLALTYPNPKIVAPRLQYLKTKHWAGY